jgi:hypothetical protein
VSIVLVVNLLDISDRRDHRVHWHVQFAEGGGKFGLSLPGMGRGGGSAAMPSYTVTATDLETGKRVWETKTESENLLRAVGRNRLIAPITVEAWVMYFGKRFFPGLLRRVGAWIQRRQIRELENA